MKKLLLLLLVSLPLIGFGQCVSGDCENGYGKFIQPDSDIIYQGEWKNSKCHGLGTMSFPDGSKYVGGFKYDKFHGQGTYTLANGTVIKGLFEDGLFVE